MRLRNVERYGEDWQVSLSPTRTILTVTGPTRFHVRSRVSVSYSLEREVFLTERTGKGNLDLATIAKHIAIEEAKASDRGAGVGEGAQAVTAVVVVLAVPIVVLALLIGIGGFGGRSWDAPPPERDGP